MALSKKLLLSMALVSFSLIPPFSSAADKQDIEEMMRANKANSLFIESYIKHSEQVTERTSHSAKMTGVAIFKENPKLIIGQGVCGPKSPIGGGGGYTGYNYSPGGEEKCECPEGNRDIECMRALIAKVYTDPRDVGGYSYYGLYADNGNGGYAALLDDGRWHNVGNTYNLTGRYSFKRPVTQAVETFTVNSGLTQLCGLFGKGRVNFHIGYGSADTMELKYFDFIKRIDPAYDVTGNIWEMAKYTGFKQNKTSYLTYANCGTVY